MRLPFLSSTGGKGGRVSASRPTARYPLLIGERMSEYKPTYESLCDLFHHLGAPDDKVDLDRVFNEADLNRLASLGLLYLRDDQQWDFTDLG